MEDRGISQWYNEAHARKLIGNLEKKGFKAQFRTTADEARDAVINLIPEGASVALAGSQTLEQIGVKPLLRSNGRFNVIDPYEPGIDMAESVARRKRGLTADVMVASTNALTEDGALLNLDGMGNRVAGMIFGPDKVILAVGMNKVVKDVHEAWRRIREKASPMNNKRLNMPNPCTQTGFCEDCASPTRICNYFTRIERSFIPGRIHIVLVGEELGY
ncbi:MAG: lactate utilization protein [Proteobacteria bacterium]|nr:lactate utilization protein [Pseudomonadota bacterium]